MKGSGETLGRDNTLETQHPFRKIPQGTFPEYCHPPYVSSVQRSPRQPLIELEQTISEITGPVCPGGLQGPKVCDLTAQSSGPAIGERIIVSGRVLDEYGRPQRGTLVEIWQANAAGRYFHEVDQHNAPLDPNFKGSGHTITDEEGRYRFVTIRPGAYPWRNHYNAWRPRHIHFSVFGPGFVTRLVTQMYFPGDTLLEYDPIYNCIADEQVKQRLIASFDWETTLPEEALGYRFDIILRGRNATPMENH
jgi:protocatechuate 3,4-dioxygenase beta subunit